MHSLLEDQEFNRLEKIYPFLSRAREQFHGLENENYVIIDIETTGLDYTKTEIIEIAALKIEKGEAKDVFNTLLSPSVSISPEIERLTGINDDMVSGQPKISEITPKLISFIHGSILVAHNSDFDIPFLKHHLNNKFENQIACTLKTSRFTLPNLTNHKLHTVAAHFGIAAENRHRALGDVETTFQVWFKLIPLLRDKGIYNKEDLNKIAG